MVDKYLSLENGVNGFGDPCEISFPQNPQHVIVAHAAQHLFVVTAVVDIHPCCRSHHRGGKFDYRDSDSVNKNSLSDTCSPVESKN